LVSADAGDEGPGVPAGTVDCPTGVAPLGLEAFRSLHTTPPITPAPTSATAKTVRPRTGPSARQERAGLFMSNMGPSLTGSVRSPAARRRRRPTVASAPPCTPSPA